MWSDKIGGLRERINSGSNHYNNNNLFKNYKYKTVDYNLNQRANICLH